MSKKKEAAPAGDVIDPKATSPSNDPNRDERAATATESNSVKRVAEKTVRRSGRNNGGDGEARGRPGLNQNLTGDTLGEREAVSPADTDVIWTNASKDKWGVDQPDFAKLLAQRNQLAGVEAKSETDA